MAAEGGAVTQITRNGGREVFEASDGKYLYYLKTERSPLWRSRSDGTEETQILPLAMQNTWALFPDGIYRIGFETSSPQVEFLRFSDNRVDFIRKLPSGVSGRGFAVSPDRKTFLFQHFDLVDSDISLVENFH